VLELTRLPAASWSSSTGCVERSAPSDAPAGWVRTMICRTAPGVTVTDTFALAEPLVAVIVEVPALSAVSCGPLMMATAGSELVQLTDAPVIACPSRAVADAESVVVVPDVVVNAGPGVIAIATGVLSGAVVLWAPESPPQLIAAADSKSWRTTDRGTCTR
jgi:hypothetical protein